jgi:hypothetical protein
MYFDRAKKIFLIYKKKTISLCSHINVAAIIPSRFDLRRPPRLPYRRLTELAIKAPMAPPIAKIATVVLHIRVSTLGESLDPFR